MNTSALLLIPTFWFLALPYDDPVTPIPQQQEKLSGEVLQVEVHLIDGSLLRGAPLLQSVPLQTKYVRMKLELRFVSEVLFQSNGEAAVTMTNGDRLQGTIQVESLTVTALIGKITIPIKLMEALHVLSPDATPTKGLVAYYPLDGGAEDLSGQNNNGAVHGASPASDRFGKQARALRFDGNSYVQVPDAPSLRPTTGLSVCAWINPQQFYSGPCQGNAVVLKGRDDLPGWYGILYKDDDDCQTFNPEFPRFVFGIKFDDNAVGSVTASSFFSPDKFYFVVGTYDGTVIRLYVDGKLEGSLQVGKALSIKNSGDLTIGRMMNQEFPYWVNGILDDIRIYNRALTDSEISFLNRERAKK